MTAMTLTSKYHITEATLEEEEILLRQACKDPEAFRPIYQRYYERIFRYIYQRIDDKEEAYDCTQQVFVKALIHLPKYQFRGIPFVSWLYRIAHNEVQQLLRNNKKISRTLNVETDGLHELLAESEAEETLAGKYEQSLSHCLSRLDETELQLVEMRYFESRPYKEIMDILSISESNAKVKVHRLLEKLKNCLHSIKL